MGYRSIDIGNGIEEGVSQRHLMRVYIQLKLIGTIMLPRKKIPIDP